MFRQNVENVVSKKLDGHRTPTEVHMYSDRGTHVPRPRYTCTPTEVHTYPDRGTHASRPRYAHIPTETRRPVSPNNLSSPIKKGTALFKAVPFFCSILSLFYPSLAMRLMSSRLLATGSEVSKPGRNMPCWRMLSSRARSGFQKPPML